METAYIRQWLKAKLGAATAITNLVSTRIYPVQSPQQPVFPMVVYTTQISNATPNMKDAGTIDQVAVRFAIYDRNLETCEAVEHALREVLDFLNQDEVTGGYKIQTARFESAVDGIDERTELPFIQVTYSFRLYRA